MEVNYFGMVRVAKACLPLLKQAAIARTKPKEGDAAAYDAAKARPAPRIVNITSCAGLMAVPFLSPYCASKHACEAWSACLRMELKAWGIHVSTANPSFHRTPLLAKGAGAIGRTWAKTGEPTKAQYGEAYFEMASTLSPELMYRHCWDPSNVVNDLAYAVQVAKPRPQLLVGLDAKCVIPLVRMLPSWLNERMTTTLGFWKMPTVAALKKA
jgi:NAD(P)-dependent dehydrogenase (short-subunit alcohol dehydrogenase family)